MKRREFILSAAVAGFLSGCATLPSLGTLTTARVPRIGYLGTPSIPNGPEYYAGFKQGMAELGYVDSQSVVYEVRDTTVASTAGNYTQVLELAQELVQVPVDVIVAGGSGVAMAAAQATSALPIVFLGTTDPIGLGLVESLAHPGGNVTGVTSPPTSVTAKRLELLARLMPGLARVGVFTSMGPGDIANATLKLQAASSAADSLGIQLKTLAVRSHDDVEPALAEGLAWSAQALLVFSGAVVNFVTERLVEFQTQNHVALEFENTQSGQTRGGLMSYTVSDIGLGRLAASLVDRILKGAHPADLPVEQPTDFEFVINQTVAQALGIAIPPEVAQEVTNWDQ
jgi:putative ABC transport system substrate-binding protein